MFAVTSCGNDWLDLAPSTQVDTETSINVLSDIEFTLNGIYSTMQSSEDESGKSPIIKLITKVTKRKANMMQAPLPHFPANFLRASALKSDEIILKPPL